MRAVTILAFAALAALALPAGSASHSGPCTHEYFDVAFGDVMDHKNGGLLRLPGDMVWAVGACAARCEPGCASFLP